MVIVAVILLILAVLVLKIGKDYRGKDIDKLSHKYFEIGGDDL